MNVGGKVFVPHTTTPRCRLQHSYAQVEPRLSLQCCQLNCSCFLFFLYCVWRRIARTVPEMRQPQLQLLQQLQKHPATLDPAIHSNLWPVVLKLCSRDLCCWDPEYSTS